MGLRSRDVGHSSVTTDAQEIAAILRVARGSERESAESRDRADTLMHLQQTMMSITAATSPREIIAATLRAARVPLGFERALWLDVETAGIVVVRFECDGGEVVTSLEEVLDCEPSSSLAAIVDGKRSVDSGDAGELGTPIVDVRGWFALVPATRPERSSLGAMVNAVVYADGHRSSTIKTWEIELLRSVVAVATIALQNLRLLEEAQTLANRDPLTGLYNRRAFAERLRELTAQRSGDEPSFVLAMIDVDDFKRINDSRGHASGDTVLKRLARTLLATSRVDDVVGRFAGDEFVVILYGVEAPDAESMVARVSANLRQAGISCSIGGASFPNDGHDEESLFQAADRALYAAKAAGKNRHTMASRAKVK